MRHSSIKRHSRRSVSSRGFRDRSGAFMLELVVGTVLLGVFLATVGPMFRWIHESKRVNDRRLIAVQELSTQMEKLASLPPARLTAEKLQSLTISESTVSALPDSQLVAKSEADGEFMQRVTLTLTWTNDAGLTVEPERLTAWFPLELNVGPE